MEKTICIYTEQIPEHYVGSPSITISCKPSEKLTFEKDLIDLLFDMAGSRRLDYIIKYRGKGK